MGGGGERFLETHRYECGHVAGRTCEHGSVWCCLSEKYKSWFKESAARNLLFYITPPHLHGSIPSPNQRSSSMKLNRLICSKKTYRKKTCPF